MPLKTKQILEFRKNGWSKPDYRIAGKGIEPKSMRVTWKEVGKWTPPKFGISFDKTAKDVSVKLVYSKGMGWQKLESEKLEHWRPYSQSLLGHLSTEYTIWLRLRSFARLGAFSSFAFLLAGIYLTHIGSLPFEIGGPLALIFGLLSLVFSTKLVQWRKP